MCKAQFDKCTGQKDALPSEYVKFHMTDKFDEWYILMHNLSGKNNEFVGGEYLASIKLPSEFPFKPPTFQILTPNGVYGTDGPVCISIGEFHADKYNAAAGVRGFCEELVNGIICWDLLGGGIRIIAKQNTLKQKREMAKASRKYNEDNHANILQLINESYANYSAKWDLTKIPEPLQITLGIKKAEVITNKNTTDKDVINNNVDTDTVDTVNTVNTVSTVNTVVTVAEGLSKLEIMKARVEELKNKNATDK